MRYVLIFILTCIGSLSYGQAYKLDDKNGFNKFQLGSSLSEIRKLVKVKKLKSKDVEKTTQWYEVSDIKEYKLFGYPLESIRLLFYKNQLLEIDVETPNSNTSHYNGLIDVEISKKIEEEYGPWIRKELTLNDTIDKVLYRDEIIGRKVGLLLYAYKGIKTGDFSTWYRGNRLAFISKDLYEKKDNETVNGL